MSNSLREKLLGLGFTAPAPEPRPQRKADTGPRREGRPAAPGKPGEPRRDGRPANVGKPGDTRRDSLPASAGKPGQSRPAGPRRPSKPRSQEEIDLAKAYAIRAQHEKDERIEAERVKQEDARLRREAKAKVSELVKDKALNQKDADIARHFPYGGKIKRIHVTPDQLKALNAGELGVLQLDGRYLLVSAALLEEAGAIFPQGVALRVDPNAPAGEDPYADPLYQIPDDLIW